MNKIDFLPSFRFLAIKNVMEFLQKRCTVRRRCRDSWQYLAMIMLFYVRYSLVLYQYYSIGLKFGGFFPYFNETGLRAQMLPLSITECFFKKNSKAIHWRRWIFLAAYLIVSTSKLYSPFGLLISNGQMHCIQRL